MESNKSKSANQHNSDIIHSIFQTSNMACKIYYKKL